MKIGFIGAGSVAQTFAKHLIYAGHKVLLSNRHADSLRDVVNDLGHAAKAVNKEEAAEADIVVLSVPWPQVSSVLTAMPQWKNQILIDATNHFETFSPDFRRADLGGKVSSELVAELAPGARVVKALNTVPMDWMKNIPGDGQTVLFISGNDADAKNVVSNLFKQLQFVPIDIGTLAIGGYLQQLDGPFAGVHFKKVGAL